MPDTVDKVIRSPDDGCRCHPKHVQQFTDRNKLYIVASCWTIISTSLYCLEQVASIGKEFTVKKGECRGIEQGNRSCWHTQYRVKVIFPFSILNNQNMLTFVSKTKPHTIATQTFTQNASLGFCRDKNDICALLGFWVAWMGPVGSIETSVRNYRSTRCKRLQQRSSHSPRNLYRVIRNDCPGFNNLSYTIHFR